MENKMKSISALALSIALGGMLFVTGTVSAQDETPKEITVSGETGLKWVNTGITVGAGDTIKLDAKGEVDVGGTWGIHGPEGTTNFSEQPPGYYPLETKLRYGLVAKVTPAVVKKNQSTQTWVYGEKKEVIAARAGTLWLTVNDDAPEGNEGEFKVTVTIIKKKK
jgi:hypothetical protein